MSSNISILENDVINKIAAGEIIEDPCSVVKELVENSIDAKAKNIEVEMESVGKSLIKVVDDGLGMDRENLQKSILKNATSKIKSTKDLFSINTMGFRGEALASIASVSKMKIESAKDTIGHMIYVENGKIIYTKRSAREKGTLVEVKSLFYNVPVREKFQKSDVFILSQITKTLHKLALANPCISFKILKRKYVGEKDLKISFQKRIKEIFGQNFFDNLQFIEEDKKDIKIYGFIGKPEIAKLNKKSQYIFVNKRVVASKLISQAVKEAYFTRIEEKKYPVFFLHFDIKKELLDVNVHPQKKEIRFQSENILKRDIKEIIKTSFEKEFFSKKKVFFENPILPFFQEKSIENNDNDFFMEEVQKDFLEEEDYIYEKNLFLFDNFLIIKGSFSSLIENKNSLLFVNLKALNAKIVFFSIMETLKKEKSIKSQKIFPPIILDFKEEEILIFEKCVKIFFSFGFEIRIIGKKTLAIDAISIYFEKEDLIRTLFEEFLNKFVYFEEKTEFFYEKIAKRASKIAKQSKKKFILKEGIFMLKKMLKMKDFSEDPFCEKIFKVFTKEEIKKFF